MLNIIVNKLQLEGREYATSNKYGKTLYFTQFIDECKYTLGECEDGRQFKEFLRAADILKAKIFYIK